MKQTNKFDSRRAMTLVEVVVIVVALTVAAVLLVSAMVTARERHNRTACMNNLRQIGMAITTYVEDDCINFGYGPRLGSNIAREGAMRFPMISPKPASSNFLFQVLSQRVPSKGRTMGTSTIYISDVRVFRCPSDSFLSKPTGRVADNGQNSYSYAHGLTWSDTILMLGGQMLTGDNFRPDPMLSDSLAPNKAPHGKAGRNVVFADGHGEWRTEIPNLKDRLDPEY